jgi:hypothetical protein
MWLVKKPGWVLADYQNKGARFSAIQIGFESGTQSIIRPGWKRDDRQMQ